MFKDYNSNLRLVYWQLLLYGVHVGHSFKNSILYSAWTVLTYKHKILILNLYKTILGFKNGYAGYDYSVKFGHCTWYINLDRSVELYVCSAAKMSGDFAYTTYWIHGMISNWLVIANTMRKLSRYTEYAHKGQFAKLEMDSSPWMASRWTWPRAVFISSVSTTMWPSHECLLTGVPSVGIVDTTIAGHISNIPAPGNDDALDSMVFYNTHIAHYILEKKYRNIVGFYRKIVRRKRMTDFNEWILFNYLTKTGILNKSKIINISFSRKKRQKMDDDLFRFVKFKNKITRTAWNGLLLFFSKNNANKAWFERLDLYQYDDTIDFDDVDASLYKWSIRDSLVYTGKISNYYIADSSWRGFKFVTRYNMSNALFNLRFRVGFYYPKVYEDDFYKTNFFLNRFCRNRFYKTFLRKRRFRSNKFICKFFKFYYLKKYSSNRSFVNSFVANFLKVSAFALVSFTFGYDFFKKTHYRSLLKQNDNYNSLYSNKKINTLFKWMNFKRNAFLNLVRIRNNPNVSKNIKFFYLYKTYSIFNLSLKTRIKKLLAYFNYFLSFWYINQSESYFVRRTCLGYLNIKFKRLKHMAKMLFYCEIYRKALYSMTFFKASFINQQVDAFNRKDVLNSDYTRYFYIATILYRRLKLHVPNNRYLFKTLLLKKRFKQLIRYNRQVRRDNRVITKLRFYEKFRDNNGKEVLALYKRFIRNPYIYNLYNRKRAVVKYFMRYKRFLTKFKNKYYVKRLRKTLQNKYNINPNHNFYQISKDIYNNFVDIKYDNKAKLQDYNLQYIDLDKTRFMPYEFFFKYHLSAKLDTFRGKYDFLSLRRMIPKKSLNFKRKLNISRVLSLKKFLYLVKQKANFFHTLLYKNNVKMFSKLISYKLRKLYNLIYHKSYFRGWNLQGGNIMRKYISNKYWIYNKNLLNMNKGFYFKIKDRYLFNYYPFKNRYLFKSYKYYGFAKSSKRRRIFSTYAYSYLIYIRFFSIYNKYINYMKKKFTNVFVGNHEFKNKSIEFNRNKRNYYWS